MTIIYGLALIVFGMIIGAIVTVRLLEWGQDEGLSDYKEPPWHGS